MDRNLARLSVMNAAQLLMLNVAHWIAGALLVFAGAVTIRNAGRPAAERRWSRLPAKAMLGLGLGLVVLELVDPLIHRTLGGETDPMVFYHSTVGVLAAIAGAAELYRLRRPNARRIVLAVFPLAWIGIGVVFLIHEQATDALLYRHWAFAISAGVLGITKLVADATGRVSERVWAVFAILAGLNFLFYWESESHNADGKPAVTGPHSAH